MNTLRPDLYRNLELGFVLAWRMLLGRSRPSW